MVLSSLNLRRCPVDQIRQWAQRVEGWSAEQLIDESRSLRYQIMAGQDLHACLPQVMGLTLASLQRVHGLCAHDVQLVAGWEMCRGRLVEMKTGEGKTLTATFPSAAYAMYGQGCHVVTVNDYLARRDAEFATAVLQCLGLKVGVIVEGLDPEQRRVAYLQDVTYGTAKELGFDFLRDRCGLHATPVQRGHFFGLVDEADSILIDEARTPLIIGLVSPEEEVAQHCYQWAARHAAEFQLDLDYRFQMPHRKIQLTNKGLLKVRNLPQNEWTRQRSMATLHHHIENAIRAGQDFHRDQHYWVVDGKVLIIDEFTGRPAEGRQWQGGLHQAVEAKEAVELSPINRSAARVTLQNYFLRYQRFAGMTGTAWTSRHEFKRIYGKRVVRVPTHRPVRRSAYSSRLYVNNGAKWKAIVDEVKEMVSQFRPVLVGTRTIDHSERLSRLLSDAGIEHQVLNARHLEREAQIIAAAGEAGCVTVATNMAGRGTDIRLPESVVQAGGLHVILSEMHESARVDWQLIGRGCRQGDPGSFRIFGALDDQLIVSAWGATRQKKLIQNAKRFGDLPLSAGWLRLFRRAQRTVQRRHAGDRRILMRVERDRRQAAVDAGQDPYLAFQE